jgi:hypothetical protein
LLIDKAMVLELEFDLCKARTGKIEKFPFGFDPKVEIPRCFRTWDSRDGVIFICVVARWEPRIEALNNGVVPGGPPQTIAAPGEH